MKTCSVVVAMALLGVTACGTTSSFDSRENRNRDDTVQEKQTLPFVGNFKVHRFLFENGLKLIVMEDHSSPTFAYHTWYKVGSKDEVPGKTGLAHLFEHMMFRETKTLK